MINYNCLTLYTLTSVSIFSILLYTFHLVLTRKICLTINLPLVIIFFYSHDLNI